MKYCIFLLLLLSLHSCYYGELKSEDELAREKRENKILDKIHGTDMLIPKDKNKKISPYIEISPYKTSPLAIKQGEYKTKKRHRCPSTKAD